MGRWLPCGDERPGNAGRAKAGLRFLMKWQGRRASSHQGSDATCTGETHTTGLGSAIAVVIHGIHSTWLGTASEDPFLLGWLKEGIETGKLNLSGGKVQKERSVIN